MWWSKTRKTTQRKEDAPPTPHHLPTFFWLLRCSPLRGKSLATYLHAVLGRYSSCLFNHPCSRRHRGGRVRLSVDASLHSTLSSLLPRPSSLLLCFCKGFPLPLPCAAAVIIYMKKKTFLLHRSGGKREGVSCVGSLCLDLICQEQEGGRKEGEEKEKAVGEGGGSEGGRREGGGGREGGLFGK